MHHAYHYGSHKIKRINVMELLLDEVFLSFRKGFILNDKDLCTFYLLSIINVFYELEDVDNTEEVEGA